MAALLLAACDKAETPPTESPPTVSVELEDPLAPPAALRRDLRTCEGESTAMQGTVEYGVRVDPTGRVTLAKALRSSAPPALLNCTLQRLRVWTFPESAEGGAFRFSMVFGRGEQPPVLGDTKTIKATMIRRTSTMQPCYAKAMRQDPSLAVKVSYEITVSPGGDVVSARAIPTPGATLPPDFVECTLAKIRAWTFPETGATKGADVSFSVVFSGS